MKHPDHDDLAAFAIGGLTEGETRSVASHLERCDRCAAEVRDRLMPAVAILAESVEQVAPPETLRQSVMAAVHADAGTASAHAEKAAREPRPERLRSRSRLASFLMRPVAGLAAIALVAAGVAGYLIAEGGGEDAETVPITQAAGEAGGSLVLDDGSATLHMHGMEKLTKGSVYQVWVATPAGIKPSATFLPHDDGTATAALPEAAGDVSEVMVTAEPGPGRTEPTLPPVMDVRLD
ncbi:MAG: anti-ECFsigma factor, ChrR [Solirubrobacterales bacterium]|nr:anti-ECFsigma factor, ChrR [Solirubrobacterales bacterium]